MGGEDLSFESSEVILSASSVALASTLIKPPLLDSTICPFG